MKTVLLLFFIVIPFHVFSQPEKMELASSRLSFTLMEKDTLFGCTALGVVIPKIKKLFGGISAIECLGENKLMLVSDQYKQDNDKSYFFITDMNGNILSADPFYGEKNIESVRLNPFFNTYYYSFEKDNSTGVGFITDKKPVNVFTEKLPSPNRGIEGLTFTKDSALWIAFESGNKTNCDTNGTTTFYKIPYDKNSGKYDYTLRVSYQYPFNRCSCLDKGKAFNGNLGNGVSEILALPDDTGKLLILERCYNGSKPNSVKLYKAQIPATPNQRMEKTLVYDLDKANLEPDNMEGMCWVTLSNGKPALFLISDDNFNHSRQKTLLIKLAVESGK